MGVKCTASREKTVRRILSAAAAAVVFGMIGVAYFSDSTGGVGLEQASAVVEVASVGESEGKDRSAAADPQARSVSRDLASESQEEPPAADSARERTFRKFSELYGGESPLIEPLFEWAILGFRTDRGNPAYALERQRILSRLGRDPAATLAVLRRGQERFPTDWGVVRNSLVNLVGQLDIPSPAKVEFLSAEIVRAPRLVDAAGEADADSFALATAIDSLSRVGTETDAQGVLVRIREHRNLYTAAQLAYVVTRMKAYFPEVTAGFERELLGDR